jgi:hypothetical protein
VGAESGRTLRSFRKNAVADAWGPAEFPHLVIGSPAFFFYKVHLLKQLSAKKTCLDEIVGKENFKQKIGHSVCVTQMSSCATPSKELSASPSQTLVTVGSPPSHVRTSEGEGNLIYEFSFSLKLVSSILVSGLVVAFLLGHRVDGDDNFFN